MTNQVASHHTEQHWTEPTVHCRYAAQRTLSVRLRVAPEQLNDAVDAALEDVFAQLEAQHINSSGAPFIAYHALSGDVMDVEVGVPVPEQAQRAPGVQVGTLPAGRYVGVMQHGALPALIDIEHALQRWLAVHSERNGGPLYVTLSQDRDAEGAAEIPCVIVARRIMGGASEPPPAVRTSEAAEQTLQRAASVTAKLLRGWPQLHGEKSPAARRPHGEGRRSPAGGRAGMRVADLMNTQVRACTAAHSLNDAAKLMWDHALGGLPVVDDARHPVGMITDRDICMAAYTQGRPLTEIKVESAMSRRLFVCRPQDSLRTAEQTMALQKVRRLPVVDDRGVLVGLLSCDDIAHARAHPPARSADERLLGGVGRA